MFLLYIDESGSPDDAGPFVVGGLAIHESEVDVARRGAEAVVAGHLDAHLRGLELHATEILGGKNGWRGIPRPVRDNVRDGTLSLLAESIPNRRLFAVARSPGAISHADPLTRVFEELLLRFSSFVKQSSSPGAPQSGLVVVDEAKYEGPVQQMVRHWRDAGTRFGQLTNIAEVPLFVDSKATRLIQLADFVAHGVFRYYRNGDESLLTPMLPAFDATGGTLHGLVHLTSSFQTCLCPACATRSPSQRRRRRQQP